VIRALVVMTAVIALALVGCGESDENMGSSGGKAKSASETATAAGGGAATGGAVTVAMRNIKFVPATIRVKVGQRITWTNDDPVAHTVTAQRGADFDSGTVNSGGRFSFTPRKAGPIDYVCTIHPGQAGTITVVH
jgi:plastocyanin